MYKQWFKEYHNNEVHETDFGFMSYFIKDNMCIINDVFIKPEFRRHGKMAELADEVIKIAKKQNCNKLIGFVNFPSTYPEYSLKAQINYGFKISAVENGRIILQKEI